MEKAYLTFRSITFAQRAEHVLRPLGIFCTLRRTPRWMEEQGCGYCLQLRYRDAPAVAQLLKERGIPYRRAYVQKENGALEELQHGVS